MKYSDDSRLSSRSVVKLVLCSTFAVLIVACSKSASNGGVTVAGAMSGYPGENPAATKDYLEHHVIFESNHPKDSAYDGLVPCDVPKCVSTMNAEVNLHITPEKHAYLRKIDAAFFSSTTGGFFMAKVVNNDSNHQKFEAWDLAWNDSVYIWAGPLPDGTKRIGVFHIAPDGSATLVGVARVAQFCPHAPNEGPRSVSAVHLHGKPYCTANKIYGLLPGNSNSPPNAGQRSIVTLANNPFVDSRSLVAATMIHNTGLWISCEMGCCEAQQIY